MRTPSPRTLPSIRSLQRQSNASRLFSSSSSPGTTPLDISSPSYAPIPNRAFISVTGPEPNLANFLNGILSIQVLPGSSPTDRTGFYSMFLSRHGRTYYDAFFHPHPSSPEAGYIIEYDPRPSPSELLKDPSIEKAPIPSLPSLLKRFVLRSKVKVKDVSDEWEAWGVWGGEAEKLADRRRERMWTGWKWAATSSAVEPTWLGSRTPDIRLGLELAESELLPFEKDNGTGSWDWRVPTMGRRLLIPKAARPILPGEYTLGTSFDYARHRIMNGVPEGSVDMAETIPFERNVDMMGGLDFRKGCYVGQENVVRTYHTGMIRKRTFPIEISPLSSPDGTPISSQLNGDYLDPAPPRLTDIILRLTPSGVEAASRDSPVRTSARASTASSSADRVRTKGKLLSRAGNWALAQLRTEHVEAFERGEMKMFIPAPPELSVPAGSVWQLTPRLPQWWPRAPPADEATSTPS
ncbi:Aminomethyltransferase folate-binding domain-containing protein [Clavulina sp. PMI_390]|nr:Aminomethyltransferase folate-binding domain-containing protein [Clavulina sp. PMI_390]